MDTLPKEESKETEGFMQTIWGVVKMIIYLTAMALMPISHLIESIADIGKEGN